MDNWFVNLISHPSIGQTILLVSATIVGGLSLSKLKIKGISLGVTWILFFGIFLGQFDFLTLNEPVLHFVKEFGLILFVYSIGLQVGPGFFSSFKNGGVTLNVLAASIVMLGAVVTYVLSITCHLDLPSLVGIMSGAVTNTPGLGAAQQTYTDLYESSADGLSAGYAIAYPMGVVGVILACIVLRYVCGQGKEEELQESQNKGLDKYTIEMRNPSCFGVTLGKLKEILEVDFVATRLYHTNTQYMEIPQDSSVLEEGDRIFIISSKESAKNIELCIGVRIDMDIKDWEVLDKHLICKKITITKSEVDGESLGKINFLEKFNVNVSRIIRGDVDIFPSDSVKLVLGDIVVVVGNEQGIQKAARFVGNTKGRLNDPYLIPIFLGVLVGIVLGSIPFSIPVVPIPVKLGLAGGPLIIAILMSRYGTQLGIVTYVTHSAKKMLQEIGISLFLAAVGLSSGKIFFVTLVEHGFSWFLMGMLITLIPVIIVILVGKLFCKLEGAQLMGLISGGMTDPAALAFANTISAGKASLSYATVYPLTMFLRILFAQILILLSV